MAPSKKAIINTLTGHGIGGAPKVSALRMTKETYNLTDNELEWALEAWNNLYIDGTSNQNTLHEALPPKSGKKYIITKWWRSWNLI